MSKYIDKEIKKYVNRLGKEIYIAKETFAREVEDGLGRQMIEQLKPPTKKQKLLNKLKKIFGV